MKKKCNMLPKKGYDITFSIMKGIAIISVVLGHVFVGTSVETIVNQYHLATFFFVSGYFLKEKQILNLRVFFYKKFIHLYAPFMEFGVLFLLIHNILYHWHLESNSYGITGVIHELRNITIGLTSEEPLMGAMWFCPALLIVSIVSAIAVRMSLIFKNVYLKYILLFIFPCIGYVLCFFGIKSPRCIWEYMQISGIFIMGYLYNKIMHKVKEGNIYVYGVFFILLISIVVLYGNGVHANLQPHMIRNENLIFALYIGGGAAIIVHCTSVIIQKCQSLAVVLSMIGNYSFSIMALHFLCFKMVTLLYVLTYNKDIELLSSFPTISNNSLFWELGYVFVGVFMPILIAFAYKRFLKSCNV